MENLDFNTMEASSLDSADELRGFRERFCFPVRPDGLDPVYFTGNSLGLMPKNARDYVDQEMKDWASLAVDAHFRARTPWLPYHEFLAAPMGRVIGATPNETVIMNSLTVNLHMMLVSFYRPTATRFKIVIEKGAFPSDQYAIKSQIDFHSRYDSFGRAVGERLIELAPREGESTLRTEDIIETIEREGDSIALILLGGVNYYTGQAFQIKEITEAGHRIGAIVGFDCAHAAGNLELRLHDWNVDFAVWCTYKYLNGGPGSAGGAFVHERHARDFSIPRFAGWWGHDKETRFLMGPDFHPIPSAEGWQVSNPAILSMASLRASLEIFDEAGIHALRKKSRKLTGYLEFLIKGLNNERLAIITPADPEQRGCQLSIRVKDGDRGLQEKLVSRGVYCDWREPGVIRVAPAPLFNSFSDAFAFSEILRDCLR